MSDTATTESNTVRDKLRGLLLSTPPISPDAKTLNPEWIYADFVMSFGTYMDVFSRALYDHLPYDDTLPCGDTGETVLPRFKFQPDGTLREVPRYV